MASNNNKNTLIISSLKMMLMSTGLLSIAILISMSMPNLLNSATYNLPSRFATLRSWLQPPYLYFIINAIIITIVASSRHHHNNHHDKAATTTPPPPNHHDLISLRTDQFSPYGVVSSVGEAVVGPVVGGGYNYNDVVSVKDVEVEVVGRFADNEDTIKRRVLFDDDINNKDFVIKESIRDDKKSTVVERSTWTPPPKSEPLRRQQALEKVSPDFFSERPPASSRFGHHRRPARATLAEGGKALRVSKPKKHDTLESTWKAITEGRHIPLTRHLKKSDTLEHHDRQIDLLNDSSPLQAAVKKSETFHERTNYVSSPVMTTKMKKEPSLGQDELNRRVEAFINKFNEDMRLQRQQSMQQFMEMINRAA